MSIELLIAIAFIFLSVLAFFSVAEESVDVKSMPLDDLAMLLLLEFRDIRTLPYEHRTERYEEWEQKFIIFCERSDSQRVERYKGVLRAVK
ncbi:hypothetical protein [Pseudoalteromonas sp. McH1-42]|uniref:hypothetical protein n=1 Tax=Pseudoalteromonas sp. McH1-42 TaxID=2917752 RepID=UPI001EF4822F|nr:hypothetical protein [Pseudoalteromonas sp. McH1-42]MCG7563328.1 hypothetical protein [Pseudoalteromonas sp. McH1-42]